MKQPTFFEGVIVALIASIVTSVAFASLALVLDGMGVLQPILAVVSFTYVIYLLARSPERVGRVTVVTIWLLVTMSSWLLGLPLLLFALIQVGFIWLIRSLYFYSSILSALADLALSSFSLLAAIWAGIYTDNLFLSIWCFFLVQALFVTIPARIGRKNHQQSSESNDRFEMARRSAEAALRKLTSVR